MVIKIWGFFKNNLRPSQHSPLLHILSIFLPSLSVFSHFCLVSAIYLPIFLPFLPVFESSFSKFRPMLRLAEQCDTKEWYISLAEQNWWIWPPLRGYFFGRTGLSFGRKKLLAPPKKCPKNAYGLKCSFKQGPKFFSACFQQQQHQLQGVWRLCSNSHPYSFWPLKLFLAYPLH